MIGFFRAFREAQRTHAQELQHLTESVENLTKCVDKRISCSENKLSAVELSQQQQVKNLLADVAQTGENMILFTGKIERQLETHTAQIDILLKTVKEHTVMLSSLESRYISQDVNATIQALKKENTELKKKLASMEDSHEQI